MVKKSTAKPAAEERKYRNFPKHTLEDALALPQKIYDEMGGKPMKRYGSVYRVIRGGPPSQDQNPRSLVTGSSGLGNRMTA